MDYHNPHFVVKDAAVKKTKNKALILGSILETRKLGKLSRGYIEGGYYQPFPEIAAGIIRMWVLFEGGPYMRKYGKLS